MSDISNIGISSLAAYQTALNIVSENIANANEPYYSRRQVDFAENMFGNGVAVADIRRVVDEQANRFAQTTNTDFSQADLYLQQLQNFEPLLTGNNSGISQSITDSLSALQNLSHNPGSTNDRKTYIDKLNNLVSQFQNLGGSIDKQISNNNQSIQTNVTEINNLLTSISSLNSTILTAPSDNQAMLQDQRESLVQQLSQYIGFTTTTDSNGSLNLFLNNGFALMTSKYTSQLSVGTDPADPKSVSIKASAGTANVDITSLVSSGKLGSLYNFKNNVLQPAERALGRLSMAMTQSFNAQNKLGIDLNGALGGNLFNDINSSTAMNDRVITNTNNTGSIGMTVSVNNISQLTSSDYKLLIGAGNTYVLTRNSDNSVMSSGTFTNTFPQTVSVDGFTMNITSATFKASDQYVISPTNDALNLMSVAITDPTKLALAMPVNADPSASNLGNGVVHVDSITNISNSSFTTPGQLSPPLKIQFLSATTYQVVNANTSAVIEGPITYNPTTGANIFPTPGSYDPGYRVSLSGTIAAGDTFNLTYNTNVSGDNRNGQFMINLYQQGVLDGGNTNFTQAYNLVSTDVSMKTQQAQINYDSKNTLNTQAIQRRDQVSGVSLEEESMNLAQYQQAYQASAQILQAARSIFEMLINIARG